jgi:glutamate formiminotransferase / 5-formyltetrahydrofolate cyclo-ligase
VRTLLAYPNVSEGRDADVVASVAAAFGPGLLDVHTDPDHHRSAYTLAGEPGQLAEAVICGAARAVELIALSGHEGVHPRVGAVDVAPIVHLTDDDRGAGCAEALLLADRLGDELGLPVFLYGELGGGRTRAELRRGGLAALAQRMSSGELVPDFGPGAPHPSAGAVLVAARPPLVAFNLVLGPRGDLELARAIAARIREGGPEGLAAVRAIGVALSRRGLAQVSTNIEDPARTTPAQVLAAVQRLAPVAEAELVGLAPEAALADWPAEIVLRGRATIEDLLAARQTARGDP